MVDFLRYRIPIRVKLTVWYIFLLGITFTAFAVSLIARFQHSLSNAVDTSLKNIVSQTVASFDEADYRETGTLTFDHEGLVQVDAPGFAMRILSVQGEVWDTYSVFQRVSVWGPLEAGLSTQKGTAGEEEWRILSQPIVDSKGQTIGWLQAAQSLVPVKGTVENLRGQLFLGIPLILLFAGLGGYFLASRALHPIEQITDTAQKITAQNLSRKIDYRGARDEVGRLAETFDHMLERLQSAFERERRFIGDAAHELRTPLTVLKGQIEVTLNRRRSPAEYEKKLCELSEQVDRLIRLSNGLLFLSRSDQHQINVEPSVINLCDLLAVLVEQTQPLAHEKELRVTLNSAKELFVSGDHDHLIRLFMNLLENSLKYTPARGWITVTAAKGSDAAHVAIHNTGPGISPEHLPHLFERFYRVEADRSSRTGGAGLGLAIAHEIARLHGGRITAQSESGQGVTFNVHLPLLTK